MENKQRTIYERPRVSRAWLALQSKRTSFQVLLKDNGRKMLVVASEGVSADRHSVPTFLEMRTVTKRNQLHITVVERWHRILYCKELRIGDRH